MAFALPAAGQAPAKKLIRINISGPADPGVGDTLMAHRFMPCVNANSVTMEAKLFSASQLGQSREVIEAMRLGSGTGTPATAGGPAEYASSVKRLGVLGLPFLR